MVRSERLIVSHGKNSEKNNSVPSMLTFELIRLREEVEEEELLDEELAISFSSIPKGD